MFQKVARVPQVFEVHWRDQFEVLPWTEDKTQEIGEFLFRTGTKGFTEIRECADGTLTSAVRYVTRAIEHMSDDKAGASVGFAASSLVYDKATHQLIGVCLCCGTNVYHVEVDPAYQKQGIATNMLKRALTVHAEHGSQEFHLWRNDNSPGASIYKRLGFVPTGEVEDPPDSWKKAEQASGGDF